MLPDPVSNPGPLTYESGALPIALRGPAPCIKIAEIHDDAFRVFIQGYTLSNFLFAQVDRTTQKYSPQLIHLSSCTQKCSLQLHIANTCIRKRGYTAYIQFIDYKSK